MNISINTEKEFDKTHVRLKTFSKVGIEGTYLSVIKVIHDKPTANIIHNEQKLYVSLKIGNKTGMSSFITLIQHSTGNSSHSNQTRRKKGHTSCKEK